jgi:hypothetical protein
VAASVAAAVAIGAAVPTGADSLTTGTSFNVPCVKAMYGEPTQPVVPVSVRISNHVPVVFLPSTVTRAAAFSKSICAAVLLGWLRTRKPSLITRP